MSPERDLGSRSRLKTLQTLQTQQAAEQCRASQSQTIEDFYRSTESLSVIDFVINEMIKRFASALVTGSAACHPSSANVQDNGLYKITKQTSDILTMTE
jgi:hypothetical protein